MQYADYVDFYQSIHGQSLRELRQVGRNRAAIFLADHPGGHLDLPATADLVIVQTNRIRGEATVEHGGGKFEIGNARPHSLVIIPPETSVSVEVAQRHQTLTLSVPYKDLLDFVGEDAGLPESGDFGARVAISREASRLIEMLWKGTANHCPWGSLGSEGLLLQLVSTLQNLGSERCHRKELKDGLAAWQIRRLTDFTMASLEKDISVTELAALCNLSPNYFCSVFGKTVGLPPHQWLRMLRIERAKSLLRDRDTSIMDIALSVGYQSHSAFGLAFKQVTGMSPRQYRDYYADKPFS